MSKYNISKIKNFLKLVESGDIELAYDAIELLPQKYKKLLRYEIELDGYNVLVYYRNGMCIACQNDGEVVLFEQEEAEINYEILTDILYADFTITGLTLPSTYVSAIREFENFARCILE